MEFRILGPMDVLHEDRALPLGGPKQRALLAMLLMSANRVVSIDRLIDDLWGDDPPATAENILQVYVSQLRKVFRGATPGVHELLVTQRPGYMLRVGLDDLDLGRFERLCAEGRKALEADEVSVASIKLRSGLALFRGRPFEDFVFDSFAQAEIERVEEVRLAAEEDRIEADLRLGRNAELVAGLEVLVRDHPLRERFREQLMLVLYRSGRQGEALETYRQGMQILGEELGISPSPTLQYLHEAILRQDPSLQPALPAPMTVAPPELERSRDSQLALAATSDAHRVAPTRHATAPTQRDEQYLPVSVLFADIVGSTSFGERMEADEVAALVGECVTRMSRAVEQAGGTVQAYMGDGICAYFGVPAPHENDPERAASAALSIQRMVRGYAEEIETAWGIRGFDVRIGLNAGTVVVGYVGAGAPQQVAFGDTTNVGSRLEGVADPGTIVMGDALARRLPARFVLEPLSPVTLKGRSGQTEVWRLEGVRLTGRQEPPTPLINRQREQEQLRGAAEALLVGRGHVLLVEGDAGLGKTRLLSELHVLVGEEAQWLEGQCRSYGERVAFSPFADAIRGWLGVAEGDPDVIVRTKVAARLETMVGAERASALRPHLSRLLGVTIDLVDDVVPDHGVIEEPRRDMIGAYLELLEAMATRSAVVVAIEDLHEGDPSTIELFEGALSITDRAAVLVIATLRPTADPGVESLRMRIRRDYRHRLLDIRLGPLSDDAAMELADALAPIGSLDDGTRREIVGRAEGNPLYVEELLRLMTTAGGLQRDPRGTLSLSRSMLLLPPALEGVLVAAIQQLPPDARRLVQIAAVIGRVFPVPVLRSIAGLDEFEGSFAAVLRAEIVYEQNRFPELECVFRHGLLRDTALATLTPVRAKELNHAVAEAFEEVYSADLDRYLGRIAVYYSRAGDQRTAQDYLERAATKALEVHDVYRAEELLSQAERTARKLDDPEAEGRIKNLRKRVAAARSG